MTVLVRDRRGRIALAVSLLMVVGTAACGSPGESSGLPPSSALPAIATPSPSLVQPSPTRLAANTGIDPYDFGYNEAVAAEMSTPQECEALARYVWDQVAYGPERETEFLIAYQGCVDGIYGRPPAALQPSDFPAGGIPYVDPCQDGDIVPWVVIYDGPGGSGDIGVSAPCQELAEEFALEQLPPGSFVVESFEV